MYSMICRWLITLTIWLLPICSVVAQRGNVASLSLDSGAEGRYLLVFSLGDLSILEEESGYSSLRADGMFFGAGMVGRPDLPTMSTLLRLPHGSRLSLNDIQGEETFLDNVFPNDRPLRPVVAAWVKDAEFPGYHPDKDIYRRNEWYRGGDAVELVPLGTMGHDDVYRLTVRPVAYNPVRGSLSLYQSLTATLSVSLPIRTANPLGLPMRYMIVAPTDFVEGLQPFVQWKRSEGFAVTEIYSDTNSREVVQTLIDSYWTIDGQTPDYLLIVGDAEQIHPYDGTTHPIGLGGHVTDLYYAEHTGDYLPDAMVGRWPVADTAALRAVVEKTLRYEKCVGLDTVALNRVLLVAGLEGTEPAPVTTNGQVYYAANRFSWAVPEIDTICYRNPESNALRADILDDIADGASMVNYTAHCSINGWSHPAVNFDDIETHDSSIPLFYINNCCLSNAFDENCFGERLLRKPQGGGVAVIGATNSTLWNEDYYWSVGPKYPFSIQPEYDSLLLGAFDIWTDALHSGSHREGITAGAIMTSGNMAVSTFGSPYDKFYWEIYTLLGDPSLRPYVGTPHELYVSVCDSIPVGSTEMFVSGSPGAKVSVVQGNKLLAMTTLDENGSRHVSLFMPVVDTLPILVTAIESQAIPAIDTAWPALPQGLAMTLDDVVASDTTVDFSLVNLCNDTIFDLTISLLPTIDDTMQANFTATAYHVDTLLPHQQLPLHIGIDIVRWAPMWKGILKAEQQHGLVDSCMLNVSHLLSDTPPTMTFVLLNTDSTVAATIEPNTSYVLQTLIEGHYDSIDVTVISLPTGDTLVSPFFTPDTITHLHIKGDVKRGSYSRHYDQWLVAGARSDSFEDGAESYPWTSGTMRSWLPDSNVSHSGGFSLRSAQIEWRQTSDLLLDLYLPAEDSISFWLKVSSEYNADFLIFAIDGMQQGKWSGGVDWRQRAYALSAGHHTLRWRYVKDDSGDVGSDCAWIDDVRLPMALWDSAYGWFGTIPDTNEPMGLIIPDDDVVHIYPNPNAGLLYIATDTPAEVQLTDMLGRVVMTMETCCSTAVDISYLSAGIYIVTTRRGGVTHHTKLNKL